MSDQLKGLKPELVWKYFSEISAIPRGSKNEKKISDYIVETAKKLGLESKRDKVLNVIVKKPSTPGYENVPMLCLQGHLDMVCEKNNDKIHNFEKDPIELVLKGNFLMANGTTLGADNGIAVATNLAIMEDKSLAHGALEFLFTVDEETGLTGANNLQPGFVESKILMNLDSEEEGAIYVGCSGGKNTIGKWKVVYESVNPKYAPAVVRVKGLRGGHSGLEIDKGRGNSLKILARVLLAIEKFGIRISTIEGGNKSNAIPREAEALIFIPSSKLNNVSAVVSQYNSIIRDEVVSVEPDMSILIDEVKAKKKRKALKKNIQNRILRTIASLPHGVIKMSADIGGLVETSTNVAIIRTDAKSLIVTTSQRSSVASEIDEIVQMVQSVLILGGAEVETTEGYPGWKPNMASPILKVAKDTYRSLYGKKPDVKAIHAGLECGIIGEKYSGMDMISFGPTLEGVHSPDEKIHIDTVEKFWNFLVTILKNVK
jgi:dipeptidase D